MWIFTNFGYFSVVRHRTNPKMLCVRGRCEDDLQSLVDKYGHVLHKSRSDVHLTPTADYCCRLLVSSDAWAQAMVLMTQDIDYDNFKDSVHDKMGHDRGLVYLDVWKTMYQMQHSLWKQKTYGDLNNSPSSTYSLTNETPTNTSRGELDNG